MGRPVGSYGGIDSMPIGQVRRQYAALMELYDADVFNSEDRLFWAIKDRCGELGQILDEYQLQFAREG